MEQTTIHLKRVFWLVLFIGKTDYLRDAAVEQMGKPLTEQTFATWATSGEECLVVMFNNVGLWLKMGDRNFWEQHRVPVANILVDHPRAFYRYLEEPFRGLRFYCIDRNHVSFVQKFYPEADVL